MKFKRYVPVLVLILCCILNGCQASPKKVDSEKAMENFLRKIEEGNYTMNAKDYLKTTVYSRDQISFDYVEDIYVDFVAMSVNNETFQAYIEDGKLKETTFLSEGQAIDAASNRLPNCWMDESFSEGNIWNLFYNIQEEPLKFVSYDDALKQSVLSFVGYGENTLRLMHEVYLVLDKEDPSSARIQAEMDEDMVARIFPEDVDIEIQFGNATSNELADAWMKAPVYPSARDKWNETDEFVFNSVFLPGYGLEAVPFPSFASYALSVDGENFVWEDAVRIRDSHASEKDMADYAAKLLTEGFSEESETQEDGSVRTVYRKLLRDEFNCYSSIALDYDNGVNITARKYYDCPEYDTLEQINEVITKIGYPALEDSDNFLSYKGTDKANEMTESWLYFFTYDLGLYVDIDYKSSEETMAYLENYENMLVENGFKPVSSEEETDYYESENGFYNFRYNMTDNDTVTLLFKSEKYISTDEAEKLVKDAGFPAVDFKEPISCRDLKLFQKTQYGRDMKFITVSQEFESAEAAEEFLSDYEEALNNAGFDRVNPENVGSLKAIAISNDDLTSYVGIDYYPEQALINFDFVTEQ
ncbi:MAG: hypothetical protein IK151_08550 [Erysipelotrichaceae bacterium]|nr:hypothetical protein [Erysipelotrichaceae bacterium]